MNLFNKLGIISTGIVLSFVAFQGQAKASSLSFSVDYSGGNYGNGNLEGLDNNADGVLTKNELTSFNFVSERFRHNINLNDLFGFGSFNLDAEVWNADGSGWGQSTGSYFSWNGGANSVGPSWTTVTTNYVSTPKSVPEPASMLGLLAVSGLGMASLKRKLAKA